MSDDLCFSTASDLVEAYSTGGLSPVEVTQALLKRIAAVNPKLNAYCLVDEDSALKDARASEARWTAGKPLGPVDGVPASIKDILLTRGWPTLRGRSEEHTSELQSLMRISYAVFCLKKKK